MTHKPFDLEKAMRNGGRCKTRGNFDVRLLCADAPGKYPVIGYTSTVNANGTVKPYTWTKEGRIFLDEVSADLDLVNIPEKRTGWLAHSHRFYGPDLANYIRHTSNVYASRVEVEDWLRRVNPSETDRWTIQEISWEE